METRKVLMLAVSVVAFTAKTLTATTIVEELEPPSTPGNAYSGTFFITPSEATWAFGVGNDAIQDTSISGITDIDGLDASDHWISSLISRAGWEAGFDFDSIRPIGADPPSSFSIDTTSFAWLWGSTAYVAFYWLSEAGDSGDPQAVLQPGTEYDAFRFFTSGPDSPFASFSEPDGGNVITGETVTPNGVPEPSTFILWSLGSAVLVGLDRLRRRRRA